MLLERAMCLSLQEMVEERLLEHPRPVEAQECAVSGSRISCSLVQVWVEVQVEHKVTMYPCLMSMMQHKTIFLEVLELVKTRQTGLSVRSGDPGLEAPSMEKGVPGASTDSAKLRVRQDDVNQARQWHGSPGELH
jgi:hypothetical protein